MKRLVILLCILSSCAGCEEEYRGAEGSVYGTTYHVSYQSATDYAVELREEMERVNRSLSMFNEGSVIARWNRGESEEVDSLFIEMYAKAREVHETTGGAFDITVAPLVNAWGFGFKNEKLPSAAKVDSLMRFVGMDKVRLEGNRVVKTVEGVQMDASSIAKGLGVDLVARFLERKGVENYMVEIGGEVRVKGLNSVRRAWRIGIDKPIDDETAANRELQFVVRMEEGALATSGNYRRFYVVDGKKYSHTINPKTGYPVQEDILGASVYAPTCMEADAYATAFMVLGTREARRIVEANPGIEACFIYRNERGERDVWMSDKFKTLILEE